VSAEEDGSVVVRWMLGSEPDERWLTVAQAKRSVDESRIAHRLGEYDAERMASPRNGLGAGLTHPFSWKS